MGVGTLARPKANKSIEKKGPTPSALSIRGSLEWRDWVDRGAKHCRTDVAKLIDAALVEYLRARGFEEPAPER